MPVPALFTSARPSPGRAARLGFDLTQISAVAHSLQRFGARFRQRLFTAQELDYADSGFGMGAERLAARFAAKEAVIKALGLSEAGVNWRDIEVVKLRDGRCTVLLHGRVAELAAAIGVEQVLLSMSHDGDYAAAAVTVLLQSSDSNQPCGNAP